MMCNVSTSRKKQD